MLLALRADVNTLSNGYLMNSLRLLRLSVSSGFLTKQGDTGIWGVAVNKIQSCGVAVLNRAVSGVSGFKPVVVHHLALVTKTRNQAKRAKGPKRSTTTQNDKQRSKLIHKRSTTTQ